jgi:hypothetical protein
MLSNSVSSRISWHSESYWAVRRRKTLNKSELSKASDSIEVFYFTMNRKETKLKGLSERRFGSMIFLLRMAGIPCQMKKVSTLYAIYMRTLIICASITYLGICVDVYVHCDDLGRAMTTVRALLVCTNIMWIFSYCRWVTSMVVVSSVSKMRWSFIPNILQELSHERYADSSHIH